MIVHFLLIFIAAACNAVMDTVDHHFNDSIFDNIKDKKKRLWFNSNQGWRNKYVDRDVKKGRIKWTILGFKFNKPVQITDSWHFFKMLMIFLICMIPALDMVLMHSNMLISWNFQYFEISPIYNLFIHWGLLGIVWNLSFFRVFYNYLLLKKK